MRVSVVNFCSTALEMLRFSSDMLIVNAGTDGFDYLVVTWNPSPDVIAWIAAQPNIKHFSYRTNEQLNYVPNLRAMMNSGFDAGFGLNDWVCIVNTDMAFGRDWLANLIRRASHDSIPNSLHLSPITGRHVVTVNLGVPTAQLFNLDEFWRRHDILFESKVDKEIDRGGWEACATMPYIIHRDWWKKYGPWAVNHIAGQEPPDRQFFRRCHEAGAKFVLVHDSIVYHHEAVERRSARPIGIETMPEGA